MPSINAMLCSLKAVDGKFLYHEVIFLKLLLLTDLDLPATCRCCHHWVVSPDQQ